MRQPLHLPSLSIENFRGIKTLRLPELSRITLLAGTNGIGKSTVLDAMRLHAARCSTESILELIEVRHEILPGNHPNGEPALFPDFPSLFNRPADCPSEALHIKISSGDARTDITLELCEPADVANAIRASGHRGFNVAKSLRIAIGASQDEPYDAILPVMPLSEYRVPAGLFGGINGPRTFTPGFRVNSDPGRLPHPINVQSLGPDTTNADPTMLWDRLALTDNEELLLRSLRLILEDKPERVAAIGIPDETNPHGRHFFIKLASSSTPVPLTRLGDGARRLFEMAITLASSHDGMLLIDEVENGIHYSVHTALWKMLFTAAAEANTQIVATTHSFDCIAAFADAARECPQLGSLFRIERGKKGLRAVHYSAETLAIAAEQHIEVR